MNLARLPAVPLLPPALLPCRASSRLLHSSRPAASAPRPAQALVCCSTTAASPAEVERDGSQPAGSSQAMPPKPSVRIDNQSDPFATVVSIKYGDKLGELLDTTAALKNLGLNIRRAKVERRGDQMVNKFYITDSRSSEKVVRSARLQEIQATIFSNLMLYHPEAEDELGWGARAVKPSTSDEKVLGPRTRSSGGGTLIQVVEHEHGDHSEVFVETVDRPGLLTSIVQTLKDLNVNVVAAEVDTEGDRAIDKFYVTYHGEPLNPPMVQLVTNALQYYLSLEAVEREESY